MHPYHAHRDHKVSKERAHKIAGGRLGYASGGGVHKEDDAHSPGEEDDSFESDRAVASDRVHKRQRHLQEAHPSRKHGGEVHGKKAKHRMDRHHRKAGGRAHGDEAEDRKLFGKMIKEHDRAERASGGRTKHKGKHVTTNVIVAPQGGGAHPVPVPVGGPPPGVLPPQRPPMAPPPAGPPGMPPGAPPGLAGLGGGAPPPGMPPMRKRGGRIGDGWAEGNKHKTPVQHTDGKTDGGEIGRPKPVTYNRGGKVRGVSVPIPPLSRIKDPVSREVQQAGEAKNNTSKAVKPISNKAPKFTGGAKSGVGRLEKIHSETRDYP